ncbi:DUF6188 family protein [Lysobacter zhanggongensis]|uniref:DUF6188 family protein n=1 Tax=Lysobacter zhanggongensis TaxID=1774951 RepID=UPI00399CCA07
MEDSWTSQLIGQTIVSVERWEGCPCVIKLSGGYRVQIESLWRLLSSGKLVLTSRDDEQLFGRSTPVQAISELSSKLVGQTLNALEVTQGTADLTLHFRQEVLQIVSDSSGYEAWQVEGPSSIVAVGQGGGSVAVWG